MTAVPGGPADLERELMPTRTGVGGGGGFCWGGGGCAEAGGAAGHAEAGGVSGVRAEDIKTTALEALDQPNNH